MKVVYDQRTDTSSVVLREGSPVAESDEEKRGVILDYDIFPERLGRPILLTLRHE